MLVSDLRKDHLLGCCARLVGKRNSPEKMFPYLRAGGRNLLRLENSKLNPRWKNDIKMKRGGGEMIGIPLSINGTSVMPEEKRRSSFAGGLGSRSRRVHRRRGKISPKKEEGEILFQRWSEE